MSCQEVQELIMEYLLGELSDERVAQLEDHLQACHSCGQQLRAWQQTELNIKDGLHNLLDSARPTVGIRELTAQSKVHKEKVRWVIARRNAVIAASITTILLFSSLFSPMAARVLAKTPVIGEPYEAFLMNTGLSVAYQAGLVHELERSVTNYGLTLTVMGAYADSTQTVILYRLEGDAATALHNDTRTPLEATLKDSFGRNYNRGESRRLDEETGIIYGTVNAKPLSSYVGHLRLIVNIGSHGQNHLSVSVPIQRVSGELNQEAMLNERFTLPSGIYGELEKLVFSPSQLVLHYSLQLPSTISMMSPEWGISVDGRDLQQLGGGGGGGYYLGKSGEAPETFRYSGTAKFEPTKAKELEVTIKGFTGRIETLGLSLLPAATSQVGATTLTMADIVKGEDHTTVHVTMTGSFVKFDEVTLVTKQGEYFPLRKLDFNYVDDNTVGHYILTFDRAVDVEGGRLEITNAYGLLPDTWSTIIVLPD